MDLETVRSVSSSKALTWVIDGQHQTLLDLSNGCIWVLERQVAACCYFWYGKYSGLAKVFQKCCCGKGPHGNEGPIPLECLVQHLPNKFPRRCFALQNLAPASIHLRRISYIAQRILWWWPTSNSSKSSRIVTVQNDSVWWLSPMIQWHSSRPQPINPATHATYLYSWPIATHRSWISPSSIDAPPQPPSI